MMYFFGYVSAGVKHRESAVFYYTSVEAGYSCVEWYQEATRVGYSAAALLGSVCPSFAGLSRGR